MEQEKVGAKAIGLRFLFGLVGGLGSIFATYLAWTLFGISENPTPPTPSTPPVQAVPRDKDGWPKKPSDNCRIFLNICRNNCMEEGFKAAKKGDRAVNVDQIKENCTEDCWAKRLQGEARELCSP